MHASVYLQTFLTGPSGKPRGKRRALEPGFRRKKRQFDLVIDKPVLAVIADIHARIEKVVIRTAVVFVDNGVACTLKFLFEFFQDDSGESGESGDEIQVFTSAVSQMESQTGSSD
jgi:hypothetical protein